MYIPMSAKSRIIYNQCAWPACEAKCRSELCRLHNRHYNQCAYPNCKANCRSEFCFKHKPETMAKQRQRDINYRLARRQPRVMSLVQVSGQAPGGVDAPCALAV
jgi:hypothetical protein